MLDTAILYLTYNNKYKGNVERATVEIPLMDYAKGKGKQLEPRQMETDKEQITENKRAADRLKDFKNSVKRDLTSIENLKCNYTEKTGANRGDYVSMRLISSHQIRTIKGTPIIRINFDVDMAQYLIRSHMMYFPLCLLRLDERNPNAYTIGKEIANHSSMDNNYARGTDLTLSVKSLLNVAPEIISIDEMKRQRQRNWKEKIKTPLEKALNCNMEIGFITEWEYRDSRTGNTYTPETANSLTWNDYSSLMIDYKLSPNQLQLERRQQKEKERTAAKAKNT